MGSVDDQAPGGPTDSPDHVDPVRRRGGTAGQRAADVWDDAAKQDRDARRLLSLS
jgi:hypothetical protein